MGWSNEPGGGGSPTGAAGGGLGGTYPNPSVNAAAASFLTGAASADLSAEIVVGATPGGDLSNTWAAPQVPTRGGLQSDKTTFVSSSATYVSVTGLTVTVTVRASGLLLVILSVQDIGALSGGSPVGRLAFTAGAYAASDVDAVILDANVLAEGEGECRATLVSGLAPGATVVQAVLKSDGVSPITITAARLIGVPL